MGSSRGGSGPPPVPLCTPRGRSRDRQPLRAHQPLLPRPIGSGSAPGQLGPVHFILISEALAPLTGRGLDKIGLQNNAHSCLKIMTQFGPRAPSPRAPPFPRPPSSTVPVCGLWGWPPGTGLGRRREGLSRGRAGTRAAAGPRAAPPGPGWPWRCGWAQRSPPGCPAARAPQSAWSGARAGRWGQEGPTRVRACSPAHAAAGSCSDSCRSPGPGPAAGQGSLCPPGRRRSRHPEGGRGETLGGCGGGG